MARSKYRDEEPPLPAEDMSEYFVAECAEPDDPNDIRLLPPEGKSKDEIAAALEDVAKLPLADQDRAMAARKPFRYSLLELMTLTTLACLGLAAATWMPLDIFAGVAGIVFLLALAWFRLRPPQSRMSQLVWYVVGAIYVLSAFAAVLRNG
jgi:hypothetical protein